MRLLLVAVAFALGLTGAHLTGAQAQPYPSRPITAVVPFPAGGPSDAIMRNLSERMRVSLGQPLVVEYVTGAGGIVGTGRVARANPDGYTIILGHFGTHAANGAVYTLSFDLVKDFAPIALLPENPYLVVARKGLPANNLKEFVAYLKANSGTVKMGIPGAGTGPHLVGAQLESMAGGKLQYIPYRGSGPAMVDLIAGQIDLMVDQVQTSQAHIRGGTIKAFAIASSKRSEAVPDIPTVDEAGLPGLHMTLWYGLWAPANTRPNVIEKLTAAAQDAMADPAVRQRLHDLGMQIPPREKQTPQALHERQTADIAKWWPIIKAANIKPD